MRRPRFLYVKSLLAWPLAVRHQAQELGANGVMGIKWTHDDARLAQGLGLGAHYACRRSGHNGSPRFHNLYLNVPLASLNSRPCQPKTLGSEAEDLLHGQF